MMRIQVNNWWGERLGKTRWFLRRLRLRCRYVEAGRRRRGPLTRPARPRALTDDRRTDEWRLLLLSFFPVFLLGYLTYAKNSPITLTPSSFLRESLSKIDSGRDVYLNRVWGGEIRL